MICKTGPLYYNSSRNVESFEIIDIILRVLKLNCHILCLSKVKRVVIHWNFDIG